MNRQLAYRPRYHQARSNPRFLSCSRQDYSHQRWIFRPQRAAYPKHVLGAGLALVPCGWRTVRAADLRLA
ncbi:MAG: hypothetical protein ACRDHZ_08585 [Ktedonobacteraceae bacterium]